MGSISQIHFPNTCNQLYTSLTVLLETDNPLVGGRDNQRGGGQAVRNYPGLLENFEYKSLYYIVVGKKLETWYKNLYK